MVATIQNNCVIYCGKIYMGFITELLFYNIV